MSTSNKVCEDGASILLNDDVCDVNDMLRNIGENLSTCANCGKEDSDVINTCNKCNMVKYCNAACKKKHRHKHKKDCEEHIRLAAERAAELHDEELFKEPPSPFGDCPICFLRMPILDSGRSYNTCCGKIICSGCMHAPVYDSQGNKVDDKCPFCRTLSHKSVDEAVGQNKERMEKDDAQAIFNLGVYYNDGLHGFTQDYTKALELFHRAGELGHAEAYCNIGHTYDEFGRGVEVDKEKANHYYELAAIRGSIPARHNLGNHEYLEGNMDRALKHHMIAVRSGYNDSLNMIQELCKYGHVTKDDYTKALRSYQTYLGEIKSPQRDKVAAANNQYRYY